MQNGGTERPGPDGSAGDRPGSVNVRRLTLAAIGVVYGDIGTSPLYAIRECFHGTYGTTPSPENILGVCSLVFWALLLVIVVKYLSFVMRADNNGEGGVLALLALGERGAEKRNPRVRVIAFMLALFGTALLYGDGMITPAISVLSAVEGLEIAVPGLEPLVVYIALALLVGLFWVQRRGTERIGAWFGPISLVWFLAIACAGIPWIVREPGVLAAVNPLYAVRLLIDATGPGFFILGAVVLCVTGCEQLFADIGHFGRLPITLAWYAVVFPCLLLSYFGQGAYLLSAGAAGIENPFFGLLPEILLLPMVGLATLATIVASQAVISGSFSLTAQAIQLGYLPRMQIIHTSVHKEGQIYIPAVNWFLMLACIGLVLEFRASTGLAAAYGIAVTGAMTTTSILFLPIARRRLGLVATIGLGALFLVVDVSLFASNLPKIPHGAAFPLLIGVVLFTVMTTWRRGSELLNKHLNDVTLPLTSFIADVGREKPLRVLGTAVFMSGYPDGLPLALGHHFKHSKSLHERIVLLSIVTEHYPAVPRRDRVRVEFLGEGFVRVTARYGFMQTPSIADILRQIAATGVPVTVDQASFFLGRVTVLSGPKPDMARWRKKLFAALHYTAQPAAGYFGIPPGRAVELGMQITI
ncbi:MAG: potassium transporter Kup [Deltaproteobacteria bacterium]|nr:potassium transporter Kup [Deltaproteobacteria bacterium]